MVAGCWSRAAVEYCWKKVGIHGKTSGTKRMSTGGCIIGAREMIEDGVLGVGEAWG